ncbi:MAG: DUF2892 domain-containing protein [Sulfuricaulis sp.]|nr:DUF2892 domain-containing protein [Sulfuricaulis sp.]
MSERIYRLLVGLSVLSILYLDSKPAMYVVIAVMVFEAVTNWRIPLLVSRIRYGKTEMSKLANRASGGGNRFQFEAERALRLLFSSVLLVTYILFNKNLWLFPWFAGFALAVAGLSGICPMLLFLEKLGFRSSGKSTTVGAA